MDLAILEKIREAKAAKSIRTGCSELTHLELESIAPEPPTIPRIIHPVQDGMKVCKGYNGPCSVAGTEPQPIENFSMTGRTARRSICKVCFAAKQRDWRTSEAYRTWFNDWKQRSGVATQRANNQRRSRKKKGQPEVTSEE